MSTEDKIILKCVIVGKSGCGKTCLLSKYIDNQYTDNQKSTIGVNFKTKELMIENKNYQLIFWDMAGNNQYAALMKAYYRSAAVVFFMYDCTRQDSFDMLNKYVEETNKYIDTPFTRVLISNKNDSHPALIKISPSKGKKIADNNNMVFLDLSVQNDTNTNITEKIGTAIKYSVEMLSELKQMQNSSPDKLKKIKQMYFGDDCINNDYIDEHNKLSESEITNLIQGLKNINSLTADDLSKLSTTKIIEFMQTLEDIEQLTEDDYNDLISADPSIVQQLTDLESTTNMINDRMNELMSEDYNDEDYDDDTSTNKKITEDELNDICELKCNGLLNNLHKNDPEYTVPTECAICNDKFDTKCLHRTLTM